MSKGLGQSIHWSNKLTGEMTERDWKIFREDQHIVVKRAVFNGRAHNSASSSNQRIPYPFRYWSESGLPKELLDAVYKAGYTKPTAIQMQAIPIALQGRDMIGLSSTGSGKTAAFILPMLTMIKELPPITAATSALDGPYALVLAPSRELAIQIEQESKKFASFCEIKSTCIVGGRSAAEQTMTLSQGVELIVATPGRLVDSIDAKQTVLNQCFYVVLDEADKMIDLGFESYVNSVLDAIPSREDEPGVDSQSMNQSTNSSFIPHRIMQMFSATMPASVERLTKKYLMCPLTVTIGDVGTGGGKPEIEQRVEILQMESDKKRKLLEIVSPRLDFPMMVFVNSKRQADFVGNTLDNLGVRTAVLHSGKVQQKREQAIDSFRNGKCDVLVATDVAGRGIDVPNVKHVVNFDMPNNIEDYTHRIGRTARTAGTTGVATSFLIVAEDQHIIESLKKFLRQSKQYVPPEIERMHERTTGADSQQQHKRKWDQDEFDMDHVD